MRLIESYQVQEKGFHPVLIQDSWQVGVLNFAEEYQIDHLKSLKKHPQSGRALSLLTGRAVLIASDEGPDFQVLFMQRGTSYHIPPHVGYALVMQEGSQLLVVEKPQAHEDEMAVVDLTAEQLQSLQQRVKEALQNENK